MENALPLSNVRTQLCIVLDGWDAKADRELLWNEHSEEFLRKVYRHGIQITIIGPRPPRKFGSKRAMRFMDRHTVVGMKDLEASRSHRWELRVLNQKTKAWTRLRAETLIVHSREGVWSEPFAGWVGPGTLTIGALERWLFEFGSLPARSYTFLGSSNRVFQVACAVLDRGAKSAVVLEPGRSARAWRSARDRFVQKGGRLLLEQRLKRAEYRPREGGTDLFVENEKGTMILPTETLVLSSINDEALNDPQEWKVGLFALQKRSPNEGPRLEEEHWLERLDWRELYWRVARRFQIVDQGDAEGAIDQLKAERKRVLSYREQGSESEMGYSGKVLDRPTLQRVLSGGSVPKSFHRPKPVASLECFESIACRACADSCPEEAIELKELVDAPKILAEKCTGCGQCVAACPAGAAVMLREDSTGQSMRYFFADDSSEIWKPGTSLQLLNRRGDSLGVGKVVNVQSYKPGRHRVLEVEASSVYSMDARGFRKIPASDGSDWEEQRALARNPLDEKVWVVLNGTRRLAPPGLPLSLALSQMGVRRFEDALFCKDGGCGLCRVKVNGETVFACATLVKEEMSIEASSHRLDPKLIRCPCLSISADQLADLEKDGASHSLACEATGYGSGSCHGRWCRQMGSRDSSPAAAKVRNRFFGFQAFPWRDVRLSDLADPSSVEAGSGDSFDEDGS